MWHVTRATRVAIQEKEGNDNLGCRNRCNVLNSVDAEGLLTGEVTTPSTHPGCQVLEVVGLGMFIEKKRRTF